MKTKQVSNLEFMVEKGVCVRILDKEFRISCSTEYEQELRDAAVYLDKQMRKIRKTGRVIGIERIAVMAALNITHDLVSLKKGGSQTTEEFTNRLLALHAKIDDALAPNAARNENEELFTQESDETSAEIPETEDSVVL